MDRDPNRDLHFRIWIETISTDVAHHRLHQDIAASAREVGALIPELRWIGFPLARCVNRIRRVRDLLRIHRCAAAYQELEDLRALLVGYLQLTKAGSEQQRPPPRKDVAEVAPFQVETARARDMRRPTEARTRPQVAETKNFISEHRPTTARAEERRVRDEEHERHGLARTVTIAFSLTIVLGFAFLSVGIPFAAAQEDPSLSLSPTTGAAGSQTTATGSGFARSGCVDIFFDSLENLLQAQVPVEDGSFSVVITIPGEAAPGSYKIIAQGLLPGVEFCGGPSEETATAGFVVSEEFPEVRRAFPVGTPAPPVVIDIDLSTLPTSPPWRPGDLMLPVIEPAEEQPIPESGVLSSTGDESASETKEEALSSPDHTFSTPIVNFEGIPATLVPNGFGLFPPDTVGDVGPNHYVQMVNVHFAIRDKSGMLLAGPTPINCIWRGTPDCSQPAPDGFNDNCEGPGAMLFDTDGDGVRDTPTGAGDGDPIVLYDHLADRWLVSQFVAFTYQCIAISATGDPVAGGWNAYEFSTGGITNDYPKFGLWPDAYYMGTNAGYPSGHAWAFDRATMLAGGTSPAPLVCSVQSGGPFMLPSDLDGPLPPPGTPNVFARPVDDAEFGGADRVELMEFSVDWSSQTGTCTDLPDLAPPGFVIDSNLCGFGFRPSCVPMPGTTQLLDTLRGVPMYRMQYRNFETYETLVFDHTVDADGMDLAGVRWYELRKVAGAWSIFQWGTHSPDATHRWMGSTAMDQAGNIAIGYSVSSPTIFPGIRYAGRFASDPPGMLPQGEITLVAGTGTQGIRRWGDYSALSVDPVDGCTFWFTTEYIAPGPSWRTRIGSFRFTECLVADVAITSFAASPTPSELLLGQSVQVTLMKTITNLGPLGPVDVDVTVTTASGLAPSPASASTTVGALSVGAVQTIVETFTLTCTTPGVQSVTFTDTIAPILATDPDPTNNVADVTIQIECLIPVQINIHPGSFPNPVNLRAGQGVITVAILSTAAGEYGLLLAVDATMMDPLSVHFGPSDLLLDVEPPGGATEVHGVGHIEDSFELDEVTTDGDLDLVLHFLISASGLDEADTEACVKGTIVVSGMMFLFFGCDSVLVRP